MNQENPQKKVPPIQNPQMANPISDSQSLPWQVNLVKPRLPWNKQPVRPAEIGDLLCIVMLKRENLLEDAIYNKVVPNFFIIELGKENYLRNYHPIRENLIEQWRARILEGLMTANSRIGKKAYRFAGEVNIQLRLAEDLAESQSRILTAIKSPEQIDSPPAADPPGEVRQAVGVLELLGGEKRWLLYPGDKTIGRSESCDIFLDLPLIQEKRLVSGKHAYARCEGKVCRLFDGAVSGKSSANGTYVNFKRIPEEGIILQNGDTIILASVNTREPQVDTPGAAAFRFRSLSELPK
jgi:hypothetical protein